MVIDSGNRQANREIDEPVLQLYPLPARERSLEGLYLDHNLRQHAEDSGECYLYSNFITSLDGRIAIPHPTRPGLVVPKDIANERDWRLFQEVAAHADIIISSGRYLRDWADGRAQEILQVDDPRFADIRSWRKEKGLPTHPDIAIVSGSLNFPIPEILTAGGRKISIFTSADPPLDRVREIEAKAGQVMVVGDEGVDGKMMAQRLFEMGYRTVYSSAGPKILHFLISAGILKRLYLSFASRILGGHPYSSLVEGGLFNPAVDLILNRLFYDPRGVDGLGQLLAVYDRA